MQHNPYSMKNWNFQKKKDRKKERNSMVMVLLLELEVGSNPLSDVEPFNIGRTDQQCPHIAPTYILLPEKRMFFLQESCRKEYFPEWLSVELNERWCTCGVNWYLTNLPALGSTSSPSSSPSSSSPELAGFAISKRVVEEVMSRILNLVKSIPYTFASGGQR